MNERTPLIVGGSLVAVLVIVALVFGLDTTVENYDTSTPEGTVQLYLQALIDQDDAAAAAIVVDDPEDPCLDDPVDWIVADARMALGEVTVGDGVANVEVLTTQIDEGAFGNSSYDSVFSLVSVDGEWRLEAADWPYGCGDVRPIGERE